MRDPVPPQPPAQPTTTAKHTRTGARRPLLLLPPTPPVRSPRAATIVRWFGLDAAIRDRATTSHDPGVAPDLALGPGTITLITGPSGAGKSSLLRDARRAVDAIGAVTTTTWIDLASVDLPDAPIIDCFPESAACGLADPDHSLREALLHLARVGLAEAWTYLRTPAELSDGQRWRLRLAVALDAARRAIDADPAARAVLVADEFAALLDRVTACVVARSLRRAIDSDARLAALVATSHHDLTRALAPDVLVRCDFGRVNVVQMPTIALSGRGSPAGRGGSSKTAFLHPQPSALCPLRTPGGPMRKILVTSLAIVALSTVMTTTMTTTTLRAADEPPTRAAPAAPAGPRGGNDRLLLEPPSPFEPPRSLFDFDPRPPRQDPGSVRLYPRVEGELDRGAGRIESDVEFELRRQQREQDARRGLLPNQREAERFDEDYDRTRRIEQQARRAEQQGRAAQRVETESQRLAADRERFYRSAGIDVSGAAADTAELRRLERSYQRDVKQLRRDRADELKRLARQGLAGDALRDARAALEARYRAAQLERRQRYAADRARVLDNE